MPTRLAPCPSTTRPTSLKPFLLFLILSLALLAIPSVHAPATSTTTPTHMVLVVLENHPLSSTNPCSNSGSQAPAGVIQCAPYLTSLGTQYSNSTNYVGPNSTSDSNFNSLPNYLVLLSGSNWGCQNYDGGPNSNTCTSAAWNCNGTCTLVDVLESKNISWKAYMEGMSASNICNGGGSQDNSNGNYIAHHDPYVYFNTIAGNSNRCTKVVSTTAGQSACGQSINPSADSNLINELNSSSAPAFTWLTPNNYDNSHDCSLSQGANAFMQFLVPKILSTYTFQYDTTATLLITFDEPSTGTYGTTPVYMAVAGAGSKTHYTSSTYYTHRSLFATIETNYSVGCIYAGRQDCAAPTMFEFFTPDFSIAPSSWSCTLTPNNPCSMPFTIFSVNGFSGTVSLRVVFLPQGMSGSMNPSSLTLSPGVRATSQMTITGTCQAVNPAVNANGGSSNYYATGHISCPLIP